MPLILGIDAAWTERGSSAVALLDVDGARRSVLAVAPSYAGFFDAVQGKPVEWRRPPGGVPVVADLLAAAAARGGRPVDVVAVDMPVSRIAIVGRRAADDAVSRAFGASGAGVHSPSPSRPDGAVTGMVRAFEAAGYAIATTAPAAVPALVEVYPLAALVRLLGVARRPAYKVAKIARYRWPGSIAERIEQLLQNWRTIREALEREVGPLGFDVPPQPATAAELKPYEDAMDAVICAWVGACVADGTATPYPHDDPHAAIWIPGTASPPLAGAETSAIRRTY